MLRADKPDRVASRARDELMPQWRLRARDDRPVAVDDCRVLLLPLCIRCLPDRLLRAPPPSFPWPCLRPRRQKPVRSEVQAGATSVRDKFDEPERFEVKPAGTFPMSVS